MGRAATQEEFQLHQLSPQQKELRLQLSATGHWKSSQMPGGGLGAKALGLVARFSSLCGSHLGAAQRNDTASEHVNWV